MMETKIIMALLLRSLDVQVAYEELDARDAKDGLIRGFEDDPRRREGLPDQDCDCKARGWDACEGDGKEGPVGS